jgi:HEAT repeat protein
LESPEKAKRQEALRELAGRKPLAVSDGDRQAIVLAVTSGLKNDGALAIQEAVPVLAEWGGDENIPQIIDILQAGSAPMRHAALDKLSGLRNDRAAKAVAALLPWEPEAARCLINMGRVAELAVLPCVDHRDVNVRRTAVDILGEIGGRRSLIKLQELSKKIRKTDTVMMQKTSAAVDKIRPRLKASRLQDHGRSTGGDDEASPDDPVKAKEMPQGP